MTISDAAAKASPSVVEITTETVTLQIYRRNRSQDIELTVGEYIPEQVREARYSDRFR